MGFMSPDLPDVDHETWHTLPRATRLQVVTRHWAEHGFGTPYAVYLLYLLKIGIYVAAPAAIISLTPGLGGLGHIADWWTQPIVYQKVIIFTLLFEVLGFGCGSGPLTGRFMPPVGGFLYWLLPKTIRLPPWPAKVPFTDGDTRTVVDVTLYAIVLISGGWALFSPGHAGQVTASGDVGLIDPILVVPTIIALALLGLRDKTVFLAARGEHYWLKLFVFFFPFTDQIAAFKIIMLCLWWGAATSKLNHHFPYVVAVMTSNNALLRGRLFNPIKHLLYRDHVNDLRPSWLPKIMAHVGGTTAEFLVPAVLVLVAGDQPWRWFLIGFMVIFHLNILSNLPMGVPLEWNVFFIFSLFYLFGHYGSIRAIDLRSPLLLAIVLAAVAVVVAGNLFPEKISFSRRRFRSCRRCATTRVTGPPACGVSVPGPRKRSRPASSRAPRWWSTSWPSSTTRTRPKSWPTRRPRSGPCIPTAGRSTGCCPGRSATKPSTRSVRAKSWPGRWSAGTSARATCTMSSWYRPCSGAAISPTATCASSSLKVNRSTSKSSGTASSTPRPD